MRLFRTLLAVTAFAIFLHSAARADSSLSPEESTVVASITSQSLAANLSFLSSDALEGRRTPSRGLDVAAEFIASRFRAAGLEPAARKSSYFQTAPWPTSDANSTATTQNVIGILRGFDPALKDTCVVLSAHYDHLGTKTFSLDRDRIYNGANDDGSGTCAIIEVASALAKVRPRRSVVFIAFFGEEAGLVGSNWYADHPVFPMAETIANINVEQIGRTDDSERPRLNELSMTGFDFSDIGPIANDAGLKVGVTVTKHRIYSNQFFHRSDNFAFAKLGVPAHTVCTAFMFPDYHQVADEWEKIDFENYTKVTRAIALAILALAKSERPPQWNAQNGLTKPFREAQARLRNQAKSSATAPRN